MIAIDGKQLRRSHDREAGKEAIYMVSAWANSNHLVLGQVKVEEKSNEITAIPKLLQLLEIEGCIVTIDAIGTQVKIASLIIDKNGDYALAVKENQGRLYEDICDLFEYDGAYDFKDAPYDYAKTVDKDHGRIEIRQCWAISDPEYLSCIRSLDKWKGLKSLIMVVAERMIGEERQSSVR